MSNIKLDYINSVCCSDEKVTYIKYPNYYVNLKLGLNRRETFPTGVYDVVDLCRVRSRSLYPLSLLFRLAPEDRFSIGAPVDFARYQSTDCNNNDRISTNKSYFKPSNRYSSVFKYSFNGVNLALSETKCESFIGDVRNQYLNSPILKAIGGVEFTFYDGKIYQDGKFLGELCVRFEETESHIIIKKFHFIMEKGFDLPSYKTLIKAINRELVKINPEMIEINLYENAFDFIYESFLIEEIIESKLKEGITFTLKDLNGE